ncbi:dicarboxylate--CoA ligase PimA [Alsobacter sp. SYSU BS001988]
MTGRAPFAWEKSYAPGARWDAPIARCTLLQLLDRAVARYGDRAAIEFRDTSLSFAELGRRVDALAAALLRAGLGPGATVALYLPNTPWHPATFFGASRAGARIVHLSPLDAERVLAHKLRDSGARTLVATDLGTSLLPMAVRLLDAGLLDRVIVGEDAAWGGDGPRTALPDRSDVIPVSRFTAGASPPPSWPEQSIEDVALLQYTGGTTGLPKGAMLTHGNLTAAVSMYNAWLEGQGLSRPGADRVIGVLPLFHIYALTTILLRQIDRGNTILLRARFDVEQTIRDIEQGRATSFPGVPTMWIALANHPGVDKVDFSSMVHCASGGAPLPVEVARRFERLTGRRLVGGWGMTETSPAGTNLPENGPSKPGTIGIPLPGVELDIVSLDDPTRTLPPGEVGELRIRGLNVTKGYWNRPEESAQSFVGDRFLTGDVGYMDEEGFFFIVDRKKDMIISGGFNVYPQMIEQAIYEHPAVAECIVLGVPDEYRGEAAKAFVTLRDGAEPFSMDDLRLFLADKVGKHEMPTALEFRASLPRTPVGKLSRAELRKEAAP